MTNVMDNVQPSHNVGLGKEMKHRLSATRDFNGPLLASSLQRLGKMPNSWAKRDVVGSPNSVYVEKFMGRTRLGEEQVPEPSRSAPNQSSSVKGKKALACARALIVNSPGAVRAAKEKILSQNHHTQDRSTHSCDADQQPRISSKFQFTAATCLEVGLKVERRDHRSEPELKQGQSGMDVVIRELTGSDTRRNDPTEVLGRVEDAGTTSKHHESSGVQTRGRDCASLPFGYTGQSSNGCTEGVMRGDAGNAEAERMDFEGDGEVAASL